MAKLCTASDGQYNIPQDVRFTRARIRVGLRQLTIQMYQTDETEVKSALNLL